MPWHYASSRLALILRRLRGRFGITAPKVTVRTEIPWYYRTLAVVVILAVSIALVGWTYDFGRRMAGFQQTETGDALTELQTAKVALEDEVNKLRSLLAASENSLQIEMAAQKQLAERNSTLAAENAKLKEELAVFERFVKLEGQASDEVSLDNVTVKSQGAGVYRFSFLITLQGARRGKEGKFNLQIIAAPKTPDGAKIKFPRPTDRDLSQYEIVLRNFRRIEGKFDVPPEMMVGAVEIQIVEAGVVKASKSLTL